MTSMYQFRCCICGHTQTGNRATQHRELRDCEVCQSTPRMRGIIYAFQCRFCNDISTEFSSQIESKHIIGIGTSDNSEIASLLGNKFSYTNTTFHTEPFLDICSPNSIANYRDLSFILCSEILEHTRLTPVEVLPNLRQMLRPGGLLILTTPTVQMANTIEWYSGAVSVDVERSVDSFVVRWRNRRGIEYVDTNPAFHGGPGDTLEMRMISHMELVNVAQQVGFRVETLEFDPVNGYYWPYLTSHESFNMVDARVLIMERTS